MRRGSINEVKRKTELNVGHEWNDKVLLNVLN